MIRRLVALVAAVSAPLAGCSPASVAAPAPTASDGGADGGAVGDACSAYAYARCTRLQACSPTAVQTSYGDQKACEAQFTAACANVLRAPSTGPTATAYQACTAALTNPQLWACPDIVYAKNFPPDCAPVFSGGPLPDGSPCGVNGQCKSAFCSIPPGAACGKCGPLPSVGDPCPCGPQLLCRNNTSCVALSNLGASCANGEICDVGLACVGGLCVAGVATPGAACSFTGAGCDFHAGLACNAVSSTCQTIALVGAGQSCGIVQNQLQECIAGQCIHGACSSYAPIGGACDLDAGPVCRGGSLATCVVASDGGTSGTCQVLGTTLCQ